MSCDAPPERTIEVPPMLGYGFPEMTGNYCALHADEILADRKTYPGAKDVTDAR